MEKLYFTVDEAEQMIPELEKRFWRITQMRGQLQEIYQRLAPLGYAPTDSEFPLAPHGAGLEVVDDLSSLKALLEGVRQEIAWILDSGCIIKDLDHAIVDWHTQLDDREVLLCWRLGEKKVTHWHEVDQGFADRKPLQSKT